ncbi:DUF4352 domain-containing protein [Staphylococcus succinus]|uniref:DUF4352 domain-containing protein n=1 Tax=Staphylococcus succinus TaxID=61015 RepID=A0A9Q6HLU2_9STAP|nr:DUF4352 domain-containing protein [Staphylococcus succinus]MEB8209454.1 DUF4352 domain-containing protein [Staphylococcus succinus]PTI62266.1 DUF4352 domain-containing protein [Staphylococcus succinus]PTI73708.1 DUF4352 domain-containing protein [Staphylococcus succinus]
MTENNLTNEALLARQQQQFEAYKQQQKKGKRKKWFWGCGGCLGLLILIVIGLTACTGAFVNEVDKSVNEKGTLEKYKDTEIKHVSDTVKVKDVEFTLNDAYYTDERNEFADEDTPADKILKVDLTVKNNGDEDIPVGGEVKAYIDGKQAKSYPIDDELLNGLSLNRSIDGSEGFAINGSPKKIELEYEQFLDFSNKKIIFEINPK